MVTPVDEGPDDTVLSGTPSGSDIGKAFEVMVGGTVSVYAAEFSVFTASF